MVWDPAAEAKITGFLETLRLAGLRIEYIVRRPASAPSDSHSAPPPTDRLSASSEPGSPEAPHTLNETSEPDGPTASPQSHQPDASPESYGPVVVPALAASAESPVAPLLEIEFTGADAGLLIERGGEVLHAIESLAAGILRLEPEENDQISFDALGFKRERQAATERTAQQGIDAVRDTGKPFVFPPMNSRERRMLHLVLAASGLPTASSGDGPRRFVVVYPMGMTPTPERFDPPPPPRRQGFSNGRGFSGRPGVNIGRGGQGGARGGSSNARGGLSNGPGDFNHAGGRLSGQSRPAPAPPRLDPNGNPLEQPVLPEAAVSTSEEERLASLRRAFRKR